MRNIIQWFTAGIIVFHMHVVQISGELFLACHSRLLYVDVHDCLLRRRVWIFRDLCFGSTLHNVTRSSNARNVPVLPEVSS